MTSNVIKPELSKLITSVNEMVNKAERFRVIKDGLKTVIIGKPNVGKSSLLNALIEQDKAIVTDVAGTTRDLVEGEVVLENITLDLIDTAGIRESNDKVEKIGIEKSKLALNEAELVILVLDASNINKEDEKLIELTNKKNRIIVYNKSDIIKHEGICICAKEKNIKELIDELNKRYQDDANLVDEDVLNNERQIALMKKTLSSLKQTMIDLDNVSIDVITTSLSESYHYLCEILGIEYQEDLIDHMFRKFCLGK